MLRGIKGDEDTAIIVTTGRFTADAEREARPSQNQRIVYLIDGKGLVEICKSHEIGVKKHKLPELLVLDEEQFGFEEDNLEDSDFHDHTPSGEPVDVETEVTQTVVGSISESAPARLRRLRESMLNEISVADIARLTGLGRGTVRTYLSVPQRKTSLARRIRRDKVCREEVLRLVELARSRRE